MVVAAFTNVANAGGCARDKPSEPTRDKFTNKGGSWPSSGKAVQKKRMTVRIFNKSWARLSPNQKRLKATRKLQATDRTDVCNDYPNYALYGLF